MSETINLQLFKHNEPLETNEEDFDIAVSLNENWDKIDEFAGEATLKIEEQDNVIEKNTNKLERLKNNQIEDTTELATTIEIQDSANVEARINIQGNTEQKQLTGKNKVRRRTNERSL